MQLCFSCSGSHILEQLLSLLPKCIGNNNDDDEAEEEGMKPIKPIKGKKKQTSEKETIPLAEEIILNICDVSVPSFCLLIRHI